jgi:hypothetical protein
MNEKKSTATPFIYVTPLIDVMKSAGSAPIGKQIEKLE